MKLTLTAFHLTSYETHKVDLKLLGNSVILIYSIFLLGRKRSDHHCVKRVRIRSFSGPYFPAVALSTERYGVSLCIQSEFGKIRTRKTRIRTLFISAFL